LFSEEGESLMISYEYISQAACDTICKTGETDPFHICEVLGILTLFEPMGTFPGACKGFFLSQSRKMAITINRDLSEKMQRIICAHELGHAVLHRKGAGLKTFHDFILFDTVSHYEYEANLFAAELLLRDKEVLDVLNGDMSFFQAAQTLNVPAELLDFKFRAMKRKGYKLDAPISTHSDFLKNVKE
jgi:Zn-dependent peptidase ImmA (M78 family)